MGSSLSRNFGRMQGVVLGTILPHVAYEWLGRCNPIDQTALGGFLFAYTFVALYVYLSSEEYGYIACLVAGFGASTLCQGCGHGYSMGMSSLGKSKSEIKDQVLSGQSGMYSHIEMSVLAVGVC